MHFDVFNGDADGIIALVQLRLANPLDSKLVTGVKRDIKLLSQVDIDEASSVTVLDISMEKNADALNEVLSHDISVNYVDHHRAGDIPQSEHLFACIDTSPETCTSLLVNEQLNGQYELWAIAAAFGDNMIKPALALCEKHQLSKANIEHLRLLGTYVNYNGYGRDLSDLHFAPEDLYKRLLPYKNPLALIDEKDSVFYQLQAMYQADMEKLTDAKVVSQTDQALVVSLPDEPWARRVSGVYGNELANETPERAHAVLTLNADKSYTVSVRAPLNNRQGADLVCIQFATGGGRSAAAGINKLLPEDVNQFVSALNEHYG